MNLFLLPSLVTSLMLLTYSRSTLMSLSTCLEVRPLCSELWLTLTEVGISRKKPTRRGCRAGVKRRNFKNQPSLILTHVDYDLGEISSHLNISSNLSNIQSTNSNAEYANPRYSCSSASPPLDQYNIDSSVHSSPTISCGLPSFCLKTQDL